MGAYEDEINNAEDMLNSGRITLEEYNKLVDEIDREARRG